ncbi:aminoacyl-tRNA hydrolase [Microbaculum marinum]|uniref:Peptidyl-tRNA hydrolase n=1 Tax=Microbaculum marinum TaxID=1764581 RepID=A0AAW9RER4_9HYPH
MIAVRPAGVVIGPMVLMVGLGNPGPKYAGNRHNIGFMAVDAIADLHRFAGWRSRFQGQVAEGNLGDSRVMLLKPMTWMNESGRAVGEAMRWLKLSPAQVIVFYDELDLVPGKVRVKTGGGAAGHNGIRSITAHIGPDFRRVRLGIGHPGHKDRVQRHVLSDFSKADKDWLGPLLVAAADSAGMLAAGDDSGFMNKVALALGSQEKAASRKAGQSGA